MLVKNIQVKKKQVNLIIFVVIKNPTKFTILVIFKCIALCC